MGKKSGEVFSSTMKILGDTKFGVTLNPGHQIHLEEWINSPFRSDYDYPIRSGTALQCDIIAFPGGPHVGIHVEDPLVVAGAELREQLAHLYPDTMERIIQRQRMMRDLLGISIKDDILPLSNIQGVLNPFLLNTDFVIAGL